MIEKLKSKPPKNGRFYTVAIDGRGGSGKSLFAENLKKLLPDFVFLNGDDYFEPTPNDIAWGAFNDERFIEDVIEPLKQGKTSIVYKPYNWHSKSHITERPINIDQGICIERAFSFGFDLDWDLKIWVETPADISLARGLERDKMPRKQALKAWNEVWKPKEDMYIKEIDPLKTADIVVDGTKPFEDQLAQF